MKRRVEKFSGANNTHQLLNMFNVIQPQKNKKENIPMTEWYQNLDFSGGVNRRSAKGAPQVIKIKDVMIIWRNSWSIVVKQ
ncbi:MAG: hypothetical protein JST09_06450 [Bacteroidetes bacterium]|nr:hypothetical protein [Bacteroidota bacterium]